MIFKITTILPTRYTNIKTNIKCLKNLTYSCKIKIKIHIPATITFMTKIKVITQKLLALLLLT